MKLSALTILAVLGSASAQSTTLDGNGCPMDGSCGQFGWCDNKGKNKDCDKWEKDAIGKGKLTSCPTSANQKCVKPDVDGDAKMDVDANPDEGDQKTSWDMDDAPTFGFGLAIEDNLLIGVSSPCVTFGSPPLSKKHSDGNPFEILNLEVWTLTPCNTMEEAEKLELSRLFLESNSPSM